jgi:hypothetical protein
MNIIKLNFTNFIDNNQFILNEFSVIKTILPRKYNGLEIIVLKNLNQLELEEKVKKIRMRGFLYNKNYYWWDANLATHYAVAEGMGIGTEDELQNMAFNRYCYMAYYKDNNLSFGLNVPEFIK